MHPKNFYKNPPNFKKLAEDYPSFRRYVRIDLSGKAKFDFQNPEALRELAKVLLLKDFNLTVEIPLEKLIPTVPLRLNYILWIEDLLKNSLGGVNDGDISGIDIGTGASCIYSLLAAKKGWKMLATEISPSSVEVALQNVQVNSLSEFITVKEVTDKNLILKGVIDEDKTYHFSMCNPPFFGLSETPKKRTEHRPPPKNATSGCQEEVQTEGGEVAFVTKMIEDSAQLKDQVLIFTTLIGKRSSLRTLAKILEPYQVKSTIVTELRQGRTTRWVLAWSFRVQLSGESPRKKKPKKDHSSLPVRYELPEGSTLEGTAKRINHLLTELKMTIREASDDTHTYFVTARENTWSNQRRKRRQMLRQHEQHEGPAEKKAKMENSATSSGSSASENAPTSWPLLEFKIEIQQCSSKVILKLSWISGSAGKEGVCQVLQYLKNHWGRGGDPTW